MMMLGITSLIVGYLIGYIVKSIKTKKMLKIGTGRFGVIEHSWLGNSFTIEVEEIEEAGHLTKVRVVEVYISRGSSYYKRDLLNKIRFKEWVSTRDIIWFSNNSQKIRDSKIDKILS